MNKTETKKIVKEAYGEIARGKGGCGCGPDAAELARSIGYSDEELHAIPDDANLGLSCGNPTALASLKEGEVVLDLGSGAGFDCFLAASRVGPTGKVIGVDMTPEMVEKARDNATKNKVDNVEFRLGEIENLPLEDNSIDVIISNCVINLSPEKSEVYKEVYRVLKPGGRISISDIALTKELPENIRRSIEAYAGCVAGAVLVDEYKKTVESSGLKDVKITIKSASSCGTPATNDPLGKVALDNPGSSKSLEGVVSVNIEGHK